MQFLGEFIKENIGDKSTTGADGKQLDETIIYWLTSRKLHNSIARESWTGSMRDVIYFRYI